MNLEMRKIPMILNLDGILSLLVFSTCAKKIEKYLAHLFQWANAAHTKWYKNIYLFLF